MTSLARFVKTAGLATVLGVVGVASHGARADEPPVSCAAWDVDYALAANLQLKDTPMGEGNGVYGIGPGKAVLRFSSKGGSAASVRMLSYTMREAFTIKSKTLFWTTTVITDTHTAATPDACSTAAEGTLANGTLRWTTPVRGYRTDGTLTCDGSLCGKFGAPPPGQTALHIGPSDVKFSPFVFAADMKTFSMSSTEVSKTAMPKQTGSVTLSGREMKRTCVAVATACGARAN